VPRDAENPFISREFPLIGRIHNPIMVRAEAGSLAPAPALTTGTTFREWHVMATPHPTAAPSFVQSLPPDPYSGDPLSVFFVVFRPLANWPGYGVDSAGTTWTCREKAKGVGTRFQYQFGSRWRPMAAQSRHSRHRIVRLRRDRQRHAFGVHCLVLEAFVGPCPPGMEGCHNDGDPENNDFRNLRWDTHAANMADAERHGTRVRGSRSPFAKLTEDQVREIRRRRAAGEKLIPLGMAYGVNCATIHRICTGQAWGHIE
jgi:hypothetical protein